jgi:hypothetical protein
MTRRATAALMCLLLAACGGSPPPKEPAPPIAPETPPAAAGSGASLVTGRMLVVDLDGKPLANMAAIATLQPNAFDQPVATGPLTGADGLTEIQFPSDARLFLRAWDPALAYFPANVFEVLPTSGGVVEDMRVEMAPSAALQAQLLLPDGAPAANENAGLMMFHPTKGAWWPANADTDGSGLVHFPNVPAGAFVLRFKTASGARIELPETPLRPGSTVDLGVVTLQ